MNFAIGKKIEMTQVFDKKGKVLPVTVIDIDDSKVVGIKTKDTDGYTAVVIGSGKKRYPTKADIGKYKALGYVPKYVSEFRVDNIEGFEIGNKVDIGNLKEGTKVDVTGVTKGKGFQGVVKRHGFKGGPRTHGQSDRLRAPGSIGARTTPGRVYKGKRMAGRMGGVNFTVKNLLVVKVDIENNLVLLKGAVPGNKGSIIKIKQ